MNPIMPFGKYKGKSLEEIAKNDPNYIEWLKNQDFVNINLKQQIMNINIHNLDKKQDSPEHNLMQQRVYLDIEKYIYKIIDKKKIFNLEITQNEIEKKINNNYCDIFSRVELNLGDNQIEKYAYITIIFEIKPILGDDFMEIIRQLEKYIPFEYRANPYHLPVNSHYSYISFPVVIYKDFQVSNLKFEEVQQIFKSKKIKLIKYIKNET